jgi:hypothetical protein
MRKAIAVLEPHPDLGFVLLHLIAAFIDGLTAGVPGNSQRAYADYLRTHFPALCKAIEPDVFYTHVRCKAVHEFALLPPLALAHSSHFSDTTAYVKSAWIDGAEWTVVNLEAILADFRSHLDTLIGGGQRPQTQGLTTLSAEHLRARGLFSGAVETLAVHYGNIRQRLQAVDKEVFMLPVDQVPDVLRAAYDDLWARCTKLAPGSREGSIDATFRRSHFATLDRIVRDIVELNRRFDELARDRTSSQGSAPGII